MLTDDQLDDLARALIPQLNAVADLAFQRPADDPPSPRPRRRPCLRCGADNAEPVPVVIKFNGRAAITKLRLCPGHRTELRAIEHRIPLEVGGHPVIAVDPIPMRLADVLP